jgi:hypothetical protein
MAAGCMIAGLLDNSYWAVAGLSLATIGLYASQRICSHCLRYS